MIHRVIFGATSQTLEHLPPRPVTSATFVIEDLAEPVDGPERELASGSATVSAVSLTLDATAGPTQADARKIPVSSTTGYKAGPWWIQGADTRGEVVWIEGYVANDYLVSRWPLSGTYAANSTIKPLAISASFPDAEAADEDYVDRELWVVWTYAIDSRTYVAPEQVRVSRQIQSDVSIPEVVEFIGDFAPDMVSRFRVGELDRWAKLAIRTITSGLRAIGREPTRFLVGDRATEIAAWRTLVIAAQNGHSPDQQDVERFRKEMQANFDGAWQALTVGHPGLEVVGVDEDNEKNTTIERPGLSFGW